MGLSKVERALHRKLAAQCFNATWARLEQGKRGSRDDRRMLDLAHASRYHWGLVGSPENKAVSDWQVSRVYAALSEGDHALLYAKSCLELCRKHALLGLVPTAYEALARANAARGNLRDARRNIALARGTLDAASVDTESREIFLAQIQESVRPIDRA
jgi:hypothetical protein